MSESNGYIGRSPGDASIIIADQYFQPTGSGKTFTFNAGYNPGYVDVYRNGVKLVNVIDYAATDGKNIILDTPVGVGSTVQVVAYKAFNLGDVGSSKNDFTVGANLLVQSGFGSFAQGITANEIDVSGIGTIGIGSFVDIHVSGSSTISGTLAVGTGVTVYGQSGIVSATSFYGDGSNLAGVSGFATALSSDQSSPLNEIFVTPRVLDVGAGTSIEVNSNATSGYIAFTRKAKIEVGTGATFAIGSGTTFITNVLDIF